MRGSIKKCVPKSDLAYIVYSDVVTSGGQSGCHVTVKHDESAPFDRFIAAILDFILKDMPREVRQAQTIVVGTRVEIKYGEIWYAGYVVKLPEEDPAKQDRYAVQCDADRPGTHTYASQSELRLPAEVQLPLGSAVECSSSSSGYREIPSEVQGYGGFYQPHEQHSRLHAATEANQTIPAFHVGMRVRAREDSVYYDWRKAGDCGTIVRVALEVEWLQHKKSTPFDTSRPQFHPADILVDIESGCPLSSFSLGCTVRAVRDSSHCEWRRAGDVGQLTKITLHVQWDVNAKTTSFTTGASSLDPFKLLDLV